MGSGRVRRGYRDQVSEPAANYSDYQSGIYANGMFAGELPAVTTDLAGLEERARAVLSPEALGYIVPSAGSGATARANRAAFDRWRIVPRMLRSGTRRDLSGKGRQRVAKEASGNGGDDQTGSVDHFENVARDVHAGGNWHSGQQFAVFFIAKQLGRSFRRARPDAHLAARTLGEKHATSRCHAAAAKDGDSLGHVLDSRQTNVKTRWVARVERSSPQISIHWGPTEAVRPQPPVETLISNGGEIVR